MNENKACLPMANEIEKNRLTLQNDEQYTRKKVMEIKQTNYTNKNWAKSSNQIGEI